jgi:protein-S-isoprenylcysteine O-methyltransferase Ste14
MDTSQLIYIIFFISAIVVRLYYVSGKKRDRSKITGWERFFYILVSIGMFLLPLIYISTPYLDFANYSAPDCFTCLGAGLFTVALWLLWRSHYLLRDNWSEELRTKKDQKLVTTGIYSRIRHPMYLAHLVWAVAHLLLLHNWIAGPSMLLALIPFYLIRVRKEEAMMLKHFGKEYEEYTEKTGRIFPKF